MRPATIVAFERLNIGSFLLGLLNAFINWDYLVQLGAAAGLGTGFAVLDIVASGAFVIGLTLLVSRKRSKVAMWIMIVMYGVGGIIMLLVPSVWAGPITKVIITVVSSVAQLLALGLLFTPSGRQWMGKRDKKGELRDTFA
jgi:hypothetical protein